MMIMDHDVFQLPSHVQHFVTPWTVAHQASLSLTISPSCWSSGPLQWWCHPAIPSSDTLFSFCLQSVPASGTFPMSQLFESDDQNTGVATSASVLPRSIQGDFPWIWLLWIPCCSRDSERSIMDHTPYKIIIKYWLYSPCCALHPC